MFKKINIFTVLVLVVTLSLALRLNTISDNFKKDKPVRIFTEAVAQQEVQDVDPPAFAPEDQVRMFDENTESIENKIQEERGLPEFPVISFSKTEIEVLQSLSKRRQSLEARERRLVQKEALLNAAEQEIDLKIKELATLRGELETLLGKQEKEQEVRLQRMVKIYENMKPKDAANIFNSLDMSVLLSVISRMSERKSAPIFASMNPSRAQEVTLKLVEQSELPKLPKN